MEWIDGGMIQCNTYYISDKIDKIKKVGNLIDNEVIFKG